MEFKIKVLSLSLVLSALMLLLLLGSIFSAASIRAREAETPVIAGINIDQAKKVVITDEKPLSLLKGEGGWNMLLDGELLPTAAAKVEDFLKNVLGLKRFTRVSSDPETFASFSLEDASAKRIQVFDSADKLLVDIYLGKAAPGSGQYLRLAGANDVIQTDSQLFISTQAKDWIDIRLFPDDLHKKIISSILIKNTNFFPDLGKNQDESSKVKNIPYTCTIVSSESQEVLAWIIKERGDLTPSNSKIESLINNFIAFSAEDIVIDSGEAKKALQNPAASITLTTQDSLRYSLLIGSGGPDKDFRYYIQGSEKKYIYKTSEWNIMQLIKRPEDFVETLKK